MKLMAIFESIVFDELRQFRIDTMRKKFNIPSNTVFLTVYHGTSEKNAKSIERTKLRSGSWVATDRETADLYSKRQAHGGKPYVMQMQIFIGSCLPNGDYITTQEDLISTSRGFVPKDLMRKVGDMN